MSVNADDLNHVLNLAHLEIAESEKPEYLHHLQDILSHMETLNAVDLSTVEPYPWVVAESTPFRKDDPQSFASEQVAKNAPSWESESFRVPKILGEEGA